jgi:cell division protein FtsL
MNSKNIRQYTIYAVIIVLSVLQIFVSNRLSDVGKKINALNQKTLQVKENNEILKKNTAQFTAINNLGKEAMQLGFTQKAEVVYLYDQYPVAQNPVQ